MMSRFDGWYRTLNDTLYLGGAMVDVGEWQSIRGDIPQAKTIELQDVHFPLAIPPTVAELQEEVKPTLPWAEDHFLERVSGEPLNPPPSASYWNKNKKAVDEHRTINEGGTLKYSHTYPERFWPKQAGPPFLGEVDMAARSKVNSGIRFEYGDLQDVVSLLTESPYTRQAYLPVWFPEDTGAVHGERVPCSLGYHFLLRNGRLNVYYFIRSCDFIRHFRNDVYLAARLCQWVEEACYDLSGWGGEPNAWSNVCPGNLIMQISSLHIFEAERKRLAPPRS
jgi:hypothetical protein